MVLSVKAEVVTVAVRTNTHNVDSSHLLCLLAAPIVSQSVAHKAVFCRGTCHLNNTITAKCMI